jgi:uncharacterized protein (DUF983 family)
MPRSLHDYAGSVSGPFDHLDPREPVPVPPETGASPERPNAATQPVTPAGRRSSSAEPGAVSVLLRGLTRRCPRCGSGGLFERWFAIRQRCPRCQLQLEREEGGFLGAMVVSYTVTAAVWLALLVAWLIVDLPDLHVAALTIASIALAGLVPLLFWPFSKTIWASVDHLVDRSTPDYPSREAAGRAAGNGGGAPTRNL